MGACLILLSLVSCQPQETGGLSPHEAPIVQPSAVTGTPVQVRTQPTPPESGSPAACPAGLLLGILASDTAEGLVVVEESGFRRAVIWPYGFSAILYDGSVHLLDADGDAIAVEGDEVSISGGEWPSDVTRPWSACGPPQVTGDAAR